MQEIIFYIDMQRARERKHIFCALQYDFAAFSIMCQE